MSLAHWRHRGQGFSRWGCYSHSPSHSGRHTMPPVKLGENSWGGARHQRRSRRARMIRASTSSSMISRASSRSTSPVRRRVCREGVATRALRWYGFSFSGDSTDPPKLDDGVVCGACGVHGVFGGAGGTCGTCGDAGDAAMRLPSAAFNFKSSATATAATGVVTAAFTVVSTTIFLVCTVWHVCGVCGDAGDAIAQEALSRAQDGLSSRAQESQDGLRHSSVA